MHQDASQALQFLSPCRNSSMPSGVSGHGAGECSLGLGHALPGIPGEGLVYVEVFFLNRMHQQNEKRQKDGYGCIMSAATIQTLLYLSPSFTNYWTHSLRETPESSHFLLVLEKMLRKKTLKRRFPGIPEMEPSKKEGRSLRELQNPAKNTSSYR